MMSTLVNPPDIEAPLHSLVASGNKVSTGDDEWENGVAFTQQGCYKIEGTCATCDIAQTNEDPQDCHPPAEFKPYLLDLGLIYSTRDQGLDIKALANTSLEVGTSSRLERLIWAGCAGDPNVLLSEGTAVGAAAAPIGALGALMAKFIDAEDHTGALGTIHMSPRIAVELDSQLREVDGVIRTIVGGHKVIIGNYPSTHIAGHVGDVDVYLGEPYLTEAVDEIRRVNDQLFRVQRLAVATWNTCAAYVQPVTLA